MLRTHLFKSFMDAFGLLLGMMAPVVEVVWEHSHAIGDAKYCFMRLAGLQDVVTHGGDVSLVIRGRAGWW